MMKTLLLVLGFALMIPLVASADTIGVFTDASGSSCDFAQGFNPNVTIIHKYSLGATAVQFKVVAAGSSIFGFDATSPYVPTGIVQTGITVLYDQCRSGSIVVGKIVANLVAVGTIDVVPADGFPNILYADCSSVQHVASGQSGYVALGGVHCITPTEPSTWGRVKSLYR